VQEKILELVTVVSRGGNYILNIGPEGDGSVVPFEADVLRGVGAWLKSNGDAVFGLGDLPPAASPFRSLDFGFATVSKDKLYLFVKDAPKDGKLQLPGVSKGVTFGDAYLLAGGAGASGKVVMNEGGAEVEAGSLLQSSSVEVMPVVVVPFSGSLRVRSAAIVAATADGSLALEAARADRFLNYNGRGYEDPATTYKLRWEIEATLGRYKVEVHYAKTEKAGVMDMIAGTERTEIPTKAGQGADVWTGEMTLPRGTNSLELTPKEPFFKGNRLPVKVESVQLLPIALTKPSVPQSRKSSIAAPTVAIVQSGLHLRDSSSRR
jgi:alpha-L-fucosidase